MMTLQDHVAAGHCPTFKRACQIAETADEVRMTRIVWRRLQAELDSVAPRRRNWLSSRGIMGKPIKIVREHRDVYDWIAWVRGCSRSEAKRIWRAQ